MKTLTSSPTALTPDDEKLDTFEFPPPSPASSSAVKKARRQTAFYPNMNSSNKLQKPFSRSAAKRESVMALGSIEHLQHYFTKTGLTAKQNALEQNKALVPAIGGPTNRPLRPSLGSVQEFHLPPSPAVPVFSRPPYPTVEKTYEVDPENLKPGVIRDLEAVSESWGLVKGNKPVEDFDVLATLQLTTQLIRTVRNYLVSMPDDSISPDLEKPQFRPGTLQPVPTKRAVSNPSSASQPLSRIRRSALEVLTVLRALEETTRLPLSDDAYDAMSDHLSSQDSRSPEPIITSLEDDEHRHHQAQGHDISFAISVVSIPGRSEAVPVWDDSDDSFDATDDVGDGKRDVWDERLVLGGGWLYRQDIRLADVKNERDVVGKYLDAVDEVLFDGNSAEGMRGWQRAGAERSRVEREGKAKSRRISQAKRRIDASPDPGNRLISTEMLDAMGDMAITEGTESPEHSEAEDSIDDDDLPVWAKRGAFDDVADPLARTYALLAALTPSSLVSLLPSPYTSRSDLLAALSSGQLLCVAYNTGIRRSRKPWGYINKDAVHDIAALELKAEAETDGGEAAEKRKTGWTFRRTDNLRLWAAALKLRYLVPLTSPMPSDNSLSSLPSMGASSDSLAGSPTKSATPTPSGSPAPARTKFVAGTGEVPLIVFDAKAVARRDDGWEAMLETVILCWVRAVVNERRGAR
ncbi:hypothetical protein DFH11DRAFT_1843327 [Phellopilus nigrolimitatus]|nr:hypothetical protein DFH11DRAFT_1843327 [Phellopilus nigrolimitatus]